VVKAFAPLEQAGPGPHAPWLFPLRKAGLARFAELGFPTTRLEDWRFTNVAPLARLPFKPVLASRSAPTLTADVINHFPFAQLAGPRLVFIDGHFVRELSTPPKNSNPTGRASSLAAALLSEGSLIERHLGRQTQGEQNAFTALNDAFFQDGAFIHVPAGQSVPEPIRLLFVHSHAEPGTTTHLRNVIIVEAGARVTLVESHVSLQAGPTVTNAVSEFSIGDNAVVEHVKFQDESPESFHIAALHSHLGRAVNFASHSIVTGAKLSRNNLRACLDGEGIEAVLNGVYLTNNDQVADHHMIVDHAKPHCASHEYFNGILAGKSKGIFHGRILVRPGAQKTDAKQTNKNLLLSDEATADAKPQLEIYADDVRCTHGATIGQLNDESIYYLRSRGIGLEKARRMLIHAFAGEIIDRVKHEAIREELDALVWDRLEQLESVAVGH
jgi:Fe-S cluster assembly protein SufD